MCDNTPTCLFCESEQREREVRIFDAVDGTLVHEGASALGRQNLPLLHVVRDIGVETAGQHGPDVVVGRAGATIEIDWRVVEY